MSKPVGPGAWRAWIVSWFVHSVRTTVAAVLSLALARLLRLPEAYWAAITTLVVMQSTLGAAWTVSTRRFFGTAVGALVGGVVGSGIGGGLLGFGLGIFALGLICGLLRLDASAYRFAGITFAIVALVGHTEPAAAIALHRFVEVTMGILAALLVSAVWPAREPTGGGLRRPNERT